MADQEPQGAAALPRNHPNNVFNNVDSLVIYNEVVADPLSFDAQVRIDAEGIFIDRLTGNVPEVDFWLLRYQHMLEISIQRGRVIIFLTYGRANLSFHMPMPRQDTETERFSHVLFSVLPRHVAVYGSYGFGADPNG